ncbi:uncharacterized protein MONBRDRAFT_38091 [Monosiga brevicollis MX1]|uniref:Uncharacterized protein n=1 Tax=Monosiga brevicollis TaxID=81824 RepID=A9V5M1_MONBE|nr:uncharacterized protein MONBRDRAFT_38091 [Monosiga brevicollis MX1]EDQ87064.1 predicted protein [Monosiga brevicollis MX1]|eukprot:XP_001748007.1 hypothetical protein [Monosiga brevicollis MX1]
MAEASTTVVDVDDWLSSAGSHHPTTSTSQPNEAKQIDAQDADADAPTAPPQAVPYLTLFRYTTFGERCLLVLAAVMALAQGAGWPLWAVWFGEALGEFDPDDLASVVDNVIDHVRLIAAMGRAHHMFQEYEKTLEGPQQQQRVKAIKTALVVFFSFFTQFAAFALAFYYGSIVVDREQCSFTEMFTSLMGVLFCGIQAGFYLGMLPNLAESQAAARSVYKLLHGFFFKEATATPKLPLPLQGEIVLRNVSFAYPARPDARVLDNVSLTIPKGKTVALVGASGSGKSTIVALVQGMYPISQGQILLDGTDLATLDVDVVRSQMAVVAQEPRLFHDTLRNNVAYGGGVGPRPDDSAIEKACDMARVNEFVGALPEGLDADVGEFGDRLSGGQRQRVAIARSLVRGDQIKVLLFDEATSALDVHNEKLVQEAINNASRDRTTIIVAHRLSTIQDADVIVVMEHGRIVEQGSHQDLLQRRGAYYALYSQTK